MSNLEVVEASADDINNTDQHTSEETDWELVKDSLLDSAVAGFNQCIINSNKLVLGDDSYQPDRDIAREFYASYLCTLDLFEQYKTLGMPKEIINELQNHYKIQRTVADVIKNLSAKAKTKRNLKNKWGELYVFVQN